MFKTKMLSKQRVFLIFALIVLVLVVLYLFWAEDTIDVQQTKEAPAAQLVSVETVKVTPETVEVSAFAEVQPRWSAELRSAVSGLVLEVRDSALAGERVEKDTALITIEQSQYVAELSSAELALKQAQLALSKAEKATAIERRQFAHNGAKPPNDLALHLPELRIAKSAVQSAEARVVASSEKLKNTKITAPFSGYIVKRFVSPGQSVNVGDSLVKLVDDRRFELVAEVGRADWLLLQQPLSGLTARVLSQDGKDIAQAKIRQGGGFLDEKTRQYKVFLEMVNADKPKVLSGDFVRVLLPGITLAKTLNVPESAVTQEGYIWYLDDDDRLQRDTPQLLFRRHNRMIIRAPADANIWRIAVTPLASFLPGQQVRPQTVDK